MRMKTMKALWYLYHQHNHLIMWLKIKKKIQILLNLNTYVKLDKSLEERPHQKTKTQHLLKINMLYWVLTRCTQACCERGAIQLLYWYKSCTLLLKLFLFHTVLCWTKSGGSFIHICSYRRHNQRLQKLIRGWHQFLLLKRSYPLA